MKRMLVLLAGAVGAAACAAPALETEPAARARPMSTPLQLGDCVEARRRAAAAPDLEVDVLPAVVKQSPSPFQRMPAVVRAQVNRKGAVVKVDVVVDTLGRPVMATFSVVEATHPWLAANLRAIMPRWSYSPARLAGCKVARVYKFSATAKPKA